jgi:hypothetical protein
MKLIAAKYGVTVSGTALTLTDAAPNGFAFDGAEVVVADVLLLQVLSEGVRERHDGTAPATDTGVLHTTAGDGLWPLVGNELIKKFQAIRNGASDATVNIILYRW